MTNVTHLAADESLKPAFHAPPEQIHFGQLGYEESDNSPALKRATDFLRSSWDQAASINQLRLTPNPEDKSATHYRKVREAVDRFNGAWCDGFDGAKSGLQRELQQVETRLDTAANLKPIDKHFNAIVGTFQGMAPGERVQTLDRLIEEGDGPTLAALVEAPLFLTGLAAEQRDGIRLRLFARVDPIGLKLRDKLKRALGKMEGASLASLPMREKLREGTDRFTARSKQAEEVANRARTGFAV